MSDKLSKTKYFPDKLFLKIGPTKTGSRRTGLRYFAISWITDSQKQFSGIGLMTRSLIQLAGRTGRPILRSLLLVKLGARTWIAKLVPAGGSVRKRQRRHASARAAAEEPCLGRSQRGRDTSPGQSPAAKELRSQATREPSRRSFTAGPGRRPGSQAGLTEITCRSSTCCCRMPAGPLSRLPC